MTSATILIIEDDPTMLRVLKDNFEFSGYRVRTAADGKLGLQAALETKPDLILLDIMLPKINGYDICRRLRADGTSVPIIMLTAKGQESDIVFGLNLGADDYVTKPFNLNILLARAGACLRRRLEPQRNVFEFGECRLDRVAHKFLRNGQEVQLAPKEFRMLDLFLQNSGRALTRDKILDAVWGQDLFVMPRSVDRCVTTLRNKIEPDPRSPTYLKTLRDVGYRFEL
ncbi:MAG: response regulator transcription factor [Chloroflexi bacterium]|nr:response regulator transcription factor [Chloroflexota bacterium]